MRNIILLFLAFACTAPQEKFSTHGEQINADAAISTSDFLAQVSTDEQDFKVRGVIEEVCQMKGCWMVLQNEEGANIRVTFKDYGFFVPKDISGREVIVEGVAVKEVLAEDLAKHYADDSGKEYDESMRNSISLVAKGVLVKEI